MSCVYILILGQVWGEPKYGASEVAARTCVFFFISRVARSFSVSLGLSGGAFLPAPVMIMIYPRRLSSESSACSFASFSQKLKKKKVKKKTNQILSEVGREAVDEMLYVKGQ